MGNLLFSPSGRVGPSEFMRGATILIVIGFILSILPALSPALAAIGIISIVLWWCWIVLWIKRYHDGGKSGWMCLVPIIVFIIASIVISMVLQPMFIDPEFTARTEEAAASGDFGAIMEAAMSGGGVSKMGILILSVVNAVVAYLVAFIFNNMIKSDPHDNQFGPATPAM